MSFELLRSLYGGRGTNADLVRSEDLARLHIDTPLESYVPALVERGLDVVLTGSPGDGKSHAVRLLQGQGKLQRAVVEFDLSARDSREVAEAWTSAARAGRPFVLCGNEGPLVDLLRLVEGVPTLTARASELKLQVGRLTVARREELPPPPRLAALVDLADRSLLVEANIECALTRVCDYSFLPAQLGFRASQTSAGRNILLLAGSQLARQRFARLLALAGRRRGGHFTFRQLWQAIAFALTGGKAPTTLSAELYAGEVGLGTYPLDFLVKRNGTGPLIEAVRELADPAAVTDPDVDERLWASGVVGLGQPDNEAPTDVPSQLWDSGDHVGALRTHEQLKRYVALTHPEGEALLARMTGECALASSYKDEALLKMALEGLRRLYTPPGADEALPPWLLSGLPLWIGHSYADTPPLRRPHVAVGCRAQYEFSVLRPARAPWLDGVLGPLPDEAWILHGPSGAMLRLDPDLVAALARSPHTVGPLPLPERVSRFLARIAGWEEANPTERAGSTGFAIISRPRGELVAHGSISDSARGGAAYV
jgi:hypothetical protein